jgi:arsenite methyltransferase
MIERARSNAQKLQYNNIEFRQGDIESLPVTSNLADVIISNCVLNLVPNKHKAFSEIFRVLKPGGHFSISDIVLNGTLPDKWKSVAELYAGCISGAIDQEEYLAILEEAGFINIHVQKEKNISIPEEILQNYLEPGETDEFKKKEGRIKSLTVYGEKPAKDDRKCCGPENSCC